MSYASNTAVNADRSRIEIERMLLKYGADEFAYISRRTEAVIGFEYKGIRVEMSVPLPDKDADRFHKTPTGRHTRSKTQAFMAWEQEVKSKWRSLCLVIKALLVGVDDGVLTFEVAFMAHIVLEDGGTISQHFLPRILEAIEAGKQLNMKQLTMS